jgi:hypothetical protein
MRPRTLNRLIMLAALAAVLAAAALALIAPKAHADPDDVTYAYANTWAPAVCETLDAYPSYAGVEGVVLGIHEDGLSYFQAGQVIGLAVVNLCPRHLGLVLAWSHAVSGKGQLA